MENERAVKPSAEKKKNKKPAVISYNRGERTFPELISQHFSS